MKLGSLLKTHRYIENLGITRGRQAIEQNIPLPGTQATPAPVPGIHPLIPDPDVNATRLLKSSSISASTAPCLDFVWCQENSYMYTFTGGGGGRKRRATAKIGGTGHISGRKTSFFSNRRAEMWHKKLHTQRETAKNYFDRMGHHPCHTSGVISSKAKKKV